MKVGIVTIFDSENFGNKLQNYAMQQVLLHYADQVVTIKNKPAFKTLEEYLRRGSPLAESVWLNRLMGKKRKAKILKFQKQHIPTTRRSYCCGKDGEVRNKDCCDAYCVGSDQVWNPELGRTGGFSYLRFAQGAAFSYAASFGIETLPEGEQERIKTWLQKLPYVSLREEAGKKIVENLTGRNNAQVLVDPTMLLPREEWDQILKKPQKPLPEAYLLTYFLSPLSRKRQQAIRKKGEELGLPVIDLMDRKSPFYAIGPGEFLYLICHARFLCTDSFHASVFGFLYQRPMAIFCREGAAQNMGSRIKTLSRKFRLESCLVQGDEIPDRFQEADYDTGFQALERERQKAWEYLDHVFRELRI